MKPIERPKYLNIKQNPSKGEVFTPESLVDEMLAGICFDKPVSRILVSPIRDGSFLTRTVDYLKKNGYTDSEAKSIVIGVDDRLKYVNLLKRKGYNVYWDNILNPQTEEVKRILKMKFDAILGNPPYQNPNSKAWKFWIQFIKNGVPLLKDGGCMAYVTPIAWYDGFGGHTVVAKNILEGGNLSVVNKDVNRHFKIGESVGYFIFKNEPYGGKTKVIDGDTISVIDIHNKPKTIQQIITDKVFSKSTDKIPNKIFQSLKGDPRASEAETDTHTVKVIHSTKQTLFYEENVVPKKFKRWKVIVNLSGEWLSDKKQCIYVSKSDVPGKQMAGIFFGDKVSAINAERILKSKLYQFVIETNKTGGFNTGPFRMLPDFNSDLLKCRTDNDIYKYFGLTKGEVDYIESYF